MPMDSNLLYLWVIKRFDYYVAARTLWFNNQLNMGAILFGYAIESHFKHGLSIIKECPKKIQYSHDLLLLYEKAKEFDLFLDVEVSEDLLQYSNDFFTQRYPTQFINTVKEAEENMRCISIAPDIILAYDDLIMQLDQSIYSKFDTARATITLYAGKQINTKQGRIFFHNNHAFIKRIDEIINVLKNDLEIMHTEENETVYDLNKKEFETIVKVLNEKEKLMVFDPSMVIVNPGRESDNKHAKNFKYPGKVTVKEDGTKTWTSSFSDDIIIN